MLTQHPTHAGAHNNLGTLLLNRGDEDEALEHYRQAQTAAPHQIEAMQNIAVTLKRQGREDEAREAFDQLLSVRPSDAARLNRATLVPALLESQEDADRARRNFSEGVARFKDQTLTISRPLEELGSLSQFFLAYHGQDDKPLNTAFAAVLRRAAPSLSFHAPTQTQKPSGHKIRLGLLSHYFRNHTIGILNRDLVRRLPRAGLEVVVIGPQHEGAIAEDIRRSADRCVTLPSTLDAARQAVSALELDALLFTDLGMDPFTYLLAFSRLAPVQATTWGHPVTSGIDTVDYFLSSRHLEVPEADQDYSEHLIRLSAPPTCLGRPESPKRLDRAHFGLDENAHLYICPQTLFKLHPDIDAIFRAILVRDPLGQVVLIEGRADWTNTLRARFARSLGHTVGRVRYLPRLSHPEFLEFLRLGDVMLDPLHFSGGLTSLQAFAVGTPIITLPARYMRGRVTYAYWKQMGLDDGIAASVEDYVNKAVRLGTDRAERSRVSKAILEACPQLYDNQTVAEEIAAFFIEAVSRARTGRPC